ncbi:MAG: Vms1/Ankzf1 family peptidyl-tRNA hydrolase [Dehalococcoidales bacterium]|nr:Vms1/Ankzf1 family peptidyl-tRNA hydrolase [Dehalococcoidales bacterium]
MARQFFLTRAKMLAFLNELEGSAGGVRSVYLRVGLSPDKVKSRLEENFDPGGQPPELPGLIITSPTGAALFRGKPKTFLVLPPFPITVESSAPGYAAGPLRSLLKPDYRIALILVRLGSYAVGLCDGEKLVTSKVGTGLVHGRQRQGGSSAQRFHLRRENQIHSFLERVCGHVQEKLGTYEPDFVAYGGARMTIAQLRKECRYLSRFEGRTLPPLLDIPDPRQAVLEAAIGRVWSSKIIEWEV